NAGTSIGLASSQNVIEPEDVVFEIQRKILRRRKDFVITKKLPHQAEVRAAGELQALKVIARAKLGFENFLECLHAGAARVNERAVNVKQDQSYHGPHKLKIWRMAGNVLCFAQLPSKAICQPRCERQYVLVG